MNFSNAGRSERLADRYGQGARTLNAHDALANVSSVPFIARLTGPMLRDIFTSGVAPEVFWPHLNRAPRELPLGMLAGLLDEHLDGPERALALDRIRNVAAVTRRAGSTSGCVAHDRG